MAKGKAVILYSTVIYPVREKLGITWSEYVLLDMVYHLSAGSGTGWTTMNKYAMAETMGMTFPGFEKMKKRLIEKELLVVSDNRRGMQPGQMYLESANQYAFDSGKSKLSLEKSKLSFNKSKLSSDNNNNNSKDIVDTSDNLTFNKEQKIEEPTWWKQFTDIIEPGLPYKPKEHSKLIDAALQKLTWIELIQAAGRFKREYGSDRQDDFWIRQPKKKSVKGFLTATKSKSFIYLQFDEKLKIEQSITPLNRNTKPVSKFQ